jgi:hypothetical protein
VSTIYTLAPRGGRQLPIPNPGRGTDETVEKLGSEQTTLAGSRIQQVVAVKRTWTWAWPWLTDAQYDELLKWFDGRRGAGPFELRQNGSSRVYLVNLVGSLPKTVPYVGRCSTTMTLREV